MMKDVRFLCACCAHPIGSRSQEIADALGAQSIRCRRCTKRIGIPVPKKVKA